MDRLRYNEKLEKYNNFSCGDCFKIKINSKWKTVRIELNSKGWYLIDEDGFISNCKKFENFEIRS